MNVPVNTIPEMSLGELSLVITTLGVSPIGLARYLGENPKVVLGWFRGDKIPFIAARFMRLMVLHPEVMQWIKETGYFHF